MKNKIIAVFMAVVMAVSACCVNAFAIDFNGNSDTREELWRDWLKAFSEYCHDPVNHYDDICKANTAFIAGLGRNTQVGIGETSADIGVFIGSVTEDIFTDGKISDDTLNKFRNIFSEEGYQIDNESFNDWYNSMYGKEYYKHNLTPYPTSSQYYIFSERYQGDEKFRIFIESYDGTPLTIKEDENGKYFEGMELGKVTYKTYKKAIANKNTGEWSEWFLIGDGWNTNYVSQQKIYLDELTVRNGCHMNIKTNLPLNYWGDIIGGDPVSDWSELGDDFVDTEEGGDGLTADELGDLTDELLKQLLEQMPDLTTVEGILQAIYRKCCEISNKIGKTASNVYNLSGIQSALDKITSFFLDYWNKFSDFMQSLFVPADDFIPGQIQDIRDEFDLKFAFKDSLYNICSLSVDAYKSAEITAPVIDLNLDKYGTQRLDMSFLNNYIALIRSVICAVVYGSYAFTTYRKLPIYIKGGGEQ